MKKIKSLLTIVLSLACLSLAMSCAPGASDNGGSTGGNTGGGGETSTGTLVAGTPDTTGLTMYRNDPSKFVLKPGKYECIYYEKYKSYDLWRKYEITVEGVDNDSAVVENGILAILEYNDNNESDYTLIQRDLEFRNHWLVNNVKYVNKPEELYLYIESTDPYFLETWNWTYKDYLKYLNNDEYFNFVYTNSNNTKYVLMDSRYQYLEMKFVE